MPQPITQDIEFDHYAARVEITINQFKIMLKGLVYAGWLNIAASILEELGFSQDIARKTIYDIKHDIDKNPSSSTIGADFGSNDWL